MDKIEGKISDFIHRNTINDVYNDLVGKADFHSTKTWFDIFMVMDEQINWNIWDMTVDQTKRKIKK